MTSEDISKRLVEDTKKGMINWREGDGWWNVSIGDCLFSVYAGNRMFIISKNDATKFYLTGYCSELVDLLKERYTTNGMLEEDQIVHVFECLDSL